VTNDVAMSKLKGKKGTEVKLTIKRFGEKKLLSYTIVRGDIPVTSIYAAYMISKNIGYVYINKFGRTTHVELLSALALLSQHNCQGLIIDLRGNTGGFMEAAIRMVNEFLPEGKLIVYTEGRKYPRTEEFANGTGSCQKMPIVVLVDEGSASASEIFSGAIQDNDRGMIIGRRTFGKGLVQQPIEFSDGSAIRLTIARYYTPSGRCIQRPYVNGNDEDYEMDWLNRYDHGEFFSKDSVKLDKRLRYSTGLGRPVYGGGGIMPDIFVPQDTIGSTSYYTSVMTKGLDILFGYKYTDQNRNSLKQFKDANSLVNYLRSQNLVEQFVRYADSNGVKRRNLLIQISHKLIEKRLYGRIIDSMLGQEEYIKFINKSDNTVLKAVEVLQNGQAFPTAPAKPKISKKKR